MISICQHSRFAQQGFFVQERWKESRVTPINPVRPPIRSRTFQNKSAIATLPPIESQRELPKSVTVSFSSSATSKRIFHRYGMTKKLDPATRGRFLVRDDARFEDAMSYHSKEIEIGSVRDTNKTIIKLSSAPPFFVSAGLYHSILNSTLLPCLKQERHHEQRLHISRLDGPGPFCRRG